MSLPTKGGLASLYRFSVGDDRPTRLSSDSLSYPAADW